MPSRGSHFPLKSLRVFEAAARHMNLAKAAEELCVTYSAVSHQIRTLEMSLGVTLFDRTQKPMHLTAEGVKLSHVLTEALSDITRVTRQLVKRDLPRRLNLSCAPSLALKWLVPALKDFQARHPNMEIHLSPEAQLSRQNSEVDLAVCYGEPQKIPGWRIVATAHVEMTPVISPTLLDNSPPIRNPEDLLGYTLLHEDDGNIWTRWLSAAGVPLNSQPSGLYLGRAHLALAGAVESCGVAVIDPILGEKDIQAGNLVRLFARTVPMPHPYYLIAPEQRKMSMPGRELEDMVCSAFRKWSVPEG